MKMHRPSAWVPAGLAILALATAARAGELSWYLPADSEIVVNINVRQALDSPLIKKQALEMAREALDKNEMVKEVLADLGFDPLKDLDRVIVAGPGGKETDRGLVILQGRFDLDKFKAKAADVVKTQGDILKTHKVANPKARDPFVIWEVNSPDAPEANVFVALPDKETMLVSPGKDYVVDALKKDKTEKVALKNKEFQALLEKLDDRQTVSIAGEAEAVRKGLPEGIGELIGGLDKFTAFAGALTLSEDVKVELALSSRTGADARVLRDKVDQMVKLGLAALAVLGQDKDANPAIELALDFVKGIKVTAKEKTVIIKARLASDAIEDAVKERKEKKKGK